MTSQENGIAWTDFTSNPIRYKNADGMTVWACEKVSAGCKNCYADALSHRYGGVRRAGEWNAATMATLTPFVDEKELRMLLTSTKISGTRVFIGDMTDVFGAWVSFDLLDKLFAVFALRPDVTFQVLTKRPARMREYIVRLDNSTKTHEYADWPALFDAPHEWLTELIGYKAMQDLCETPGGVSVKAPIEFTPSERTVVDNIKRAGGFASDDDAIAYALWIAADRLDVDCPAGTFDLPWTPQMRRLLAKERRSA